MGPAEEGSSLMKLKIMDTFISRVKTCKYFETKQQHQQQKTTQTPVNIEL